MRITLLKSHEGLKPGARVDWPNGPELIAAGIARDEWGGTFEGQEYIERGEEIPKPKAKVSEPVEEMPDAEPDEEQPTRKARAKKASD